jgi:hypothetical protein
MQIKIIKIKLCLKEFILIEILKNIFYQHVKVEFIKNNLSQNTIP